MSKKQPTRKRNSGDAARARRTPPTTTAGLRAFAPSPYYENMAELRDEKPDVFKTLSDAAKMALEFYERAKQKAVNN